MKAFVLDSDSWHFKLANYGERRIWSDEETDICEYTRAVIKGGLCMLWIVLAAILGILWVGGSLYNLYEIVFFDAKLEPWTLVFCAISVGLIGAICIGVTIEWYKNRPVKDEPEKEPGFVTLAYRKVKDKTCARIEFRQKAEDE